MNPLLIRWRLLLLPMSLKFNANLRCLRVKQLLLIKVDALCREMQLLCTTSKPEGGVKGGLR
jgi:hypothetical protein